MKKLMWLTLCVPVLLLFSFTIQQKQTNGVKRVSKNLYAVSRVAVKHVSAEEQAEIKKVIAEHYGIKDFAEKEITISARDPRNRASGGIFETSIYKDWVSTRFIFWKSIRELPQEVIRANEILTKYAAAGK
ncbi:hypothetical protein [Chitinophaga nivalis]|uniref:Uncharacterized protein n=1 Tax=Chitinophaga nivalis TaxID=2991709 RepID=A0ABT3IS20_9BACT|nr:hypothetical protein [Chitinophaga nivalis]MCW3463534.1 hypothetical protein [Chitinophaga nivalis]MCW3486776.1 hypothetical protein [Chitinophaga nivalis]